MTMLPVIAEATRKLTHREKAQEMAWIVSLLDTIKSKVGMGHVTFQVDWNNRFSRRLGDSLVPNKDASFGRLRFSSTALYLRATAEEREQLVYHEAAHSLADIEHKTRCKHGPLWKRMMVRLGRVPDRCHTVNRDGLRRKNARRRAPAGYRRVNVVFREPRPTPEVTPVTSFWDDKLVAFNADGSDWVGRVKRMIGATTVEIAVVGGHQQARLGRRLILRQITEIREY